jgi:NADH-quinone oxidoreductase subunit H
MTSNVGRSSRRPLPWTLLGTLAVALGLPAALFGALFVLLPLAKPAMLDAFVRAVLDRDPTSWPYTQLLYAGALALAGALCFGFGSVFGGITIWYEMRVAARMQSRVGYNRVGAAGFLQWIADAVKLLLKEDLVPADSDHLLFRAAPYFVLCGFILTFVALPFGESLVVADLNVGLVYITSITALVVVGILLSGWSSNSKWALFGGMRSAAQVISYEIPAGIAAMVPILMAGTLSMQGIIRAQGGNPWEWFIFRNPTAPVAFLIFLTAQLAESNRPPFDLPEAESELVAGYLSEYSGFRYAIYFLVEWGNLWVMSALSAALFFGGWQIPFVGADAFASARGADILPAPGWWVLQAVSMAIFVVKTLLIVNLIIWVRWTLPRVRIDQMMNLCWKYLVPAAFLCLVFSLLWQLLTAAAPVVESATGVVLFLASLVLAGFFARQTHRNIRLVVGDRVDLSNW